jgi:hypothetical protein
VDAETMAMLVRHCARVDELAVAEGLVVGSDAYVFSLETNCSAPISPDFLTKEVGKLKEYLGIANKRPDTIALEDRALALRRRLRAERPKGRPGPLPEGGMSYDDIAKELGRSAKWAYNAIRSAQRREAAYRRTACRRCLKSSAPLKNRNNAISPMATLSI